MGQAGRGGWAVIGGSPPLAGLAVERAATGGAPGEADAIRGGRAADAVCGSHWGSLVRNGARR